MKFRFSYGELGNMNTNGWYPTYRAMTLKQANGSWLQNGLKPNTAYVGDLISTALTWEKVRTWNIGLDWGLFNNRLTGSFDAYIRYTDNMVGPSVELPATLGIATPKTNNCDLKTKVGNLPSDGRTAPTSVWAMALSSMFLMHVLI